jgi:shikimate dehydrogenase/3-dehydroquinate dehydratase type I
MKPSAPGIVVTLPARTIDEARKEIEEAVDSGADLCEIRFDRFPHEELARVSELFPCRVPIVATLRSRAEGGEADDDPESRARILAGLAHHPFRWIDAELARDMPAAEALPTSGSLGLIVSSHTRSPVRRADWARLVREAVPAGSFRKVVVPASVGQLLRELIPALPPPEESPLVALTTGASGPLLRAWSRRFGFPIVYAALPVRATEEALPAVEPSQIPVDRLKPYLEAEGMPPLFAVVGHPVAHSRSPALHARWMQEKNVVGLYLALDFESDQEFVESVPPLVEGGFRGLNVTHPFKEVALELASRIGPGASACGVANTLSLGPDEVEAENTDLVAILRRLGEARSSGLWDGTSIGVIGAGGAARATLAAARSLETPALVWARRPEASRLLAREFGAESAQGTENERPSLVVHATTLGRGDDGPSSFPDVKGWLRAGVHVIDWVYGPKDPVVRTTALRAGATYEDGSRLLIYQAAASFGLWWGDEPSNEQVAAAVGEAL